MKQTTSVIWAGALTLLLTGTAQATLFDRGGGMIYDSDQNLTWLRDANYARTSGYDSDGRMTWDAAMAWAAGLSYGGYDDWRLPTIVDTGAPGCDWAYGGTDCGFNVDTSGSELAYMWYDILGNTPYYDTSGNGPQAGWGLTSTGADGVNFLNLQSYPYWSGTKYALGTSDAWIFSTNFGYQAKGNKAAELYAWAVRSGDVAVVPEPGTVLLFGAGLVGLLGVGRRHRRRC